MAVKEKGQLIDPVAEGQKEAQAQTQTDEIRQLSIEALTMDDFQPLPVAASKGSHPFENYPQRKIKIGTYMEKGKEKDLIVSATHIVALNPKEYVHQDPSGKGVTIVSGGQEKIVDLKTFHNRVVMNERGQSINVVFDRDIVLGDGKVVGRATICPDHTARAQLLFTVDKKKGTVEVDRRYILADPEQANRLRQCFERFYNQQTRSERLAKQFDEAEQSAAPGAA